MTFVFWQGIISIHQQPFLQALAQRPGVEQVVLVVEHGITPERKAMGWTIPEIPGVQIIVAPAMSDIAGMVAQHTGAIHIMGGIKVGAMLSTAFTACVQHGCRLGIMTEPYNAAGWKGKLRDLKYRYYAARYKKSIHFALAIGRQGVAQYTALGIAQGQVYPWAYFVDGQYSDADATAMQRVVYAGRLEEAKGIYRFAQALADTGAANYTLDMYGRGADEEKLQQLITDNGLQAHMRLHNYLPHAQMVRQYARYDWVVLPSTQKDGWGAIVSEGLLGGLKAVCSSICGVSWAVQEGVNGVTFDWNKPGNCEQAINKLLKNEGFAERQQIGGWAQQALGGAAGAEYFIHIMQAVYGGGQRPGIPWQQPIVTG